MNSTAVCSPGLVPFCFNLVTARFTETWDFYTEILGFRTVYETNHYVCLVHSAGAQLGLLDHETNEHHEELVSATDARGFWLSLEVADAANEYRRLCDCGVPVARAFEKERRGVCGFMVRDPNGVLIQITQAAAQTVAREQEWRVGN